MRCGKETEEGNAFCAECLAEMEKYPVKPGAVHIPIRSAPQPKVKRKAELPPEVQLAAARKTIAVLRRWIAGLTAALLVCAGVLFFLLTQPKETAEEVPNTRNYSTSTVDGE